MEETWSGATLSDKSNKTRAGGTFCVPLKRHNQQQCKAVRSGSSTEETDSDGVSDKEYAFPEPVMTAL